MKKVLLLVAALGLLVALALALGTSLASAQSSHAGDHQGKCNTCHLGVSKSGGGAAPTSAIHGKWTDTPDACARCHRTHSAVEEALLVMEKDPLCLFCHGVTGGLADTNVLTGFYRAASTSSSRGALKAGGFDETLMNTADLGLGTGHATSEEEWLYPVDVEAVAVPATSKHTLGIEATIWGEWNAVGVSDVVANAGDTNTTLACVSCHDPHAFGQTYRMLKRNPTDSGVSKHPTQDNLNTRNGQPWQQRVLVTDQLAYRLATGKTGSGDILAYETRDYQDTSYAAPPVVRAYGEHDGLAGEGNLTDTTADFIADGVKINDKVLNLDDGSEAVITAVDDHSIEATLLKGGNNTWYVGNEYVVLQQVGGGDAYSQQLSQWCASCHDRYNAEKVGRDGTGHTDSGDAVFAYRHQTGNDPPVWEGIELTTGSHTGADDATVLTDSGANFAGVEVGDIVVNVTDGSEGHIEAGTPNTIEATLYGGAENDWDLNDEYAVYDAIDGSWESSSCSYSCHAQQVLNCVTCHVTHGTSAQMTTIVQALPWPGEGGTSYDGMGGLPVDSRTEFTGGTDHDSEGRSNLLRLDNRGVCQDPACHPKGKDGYAEAYDGDH